MTRSDFTAASGQSAYPATLCIPTIPESHSDCPHPVSSQIEIPRATSNGLHRRGELHKIRPGVYAPSDAWSALTLPQQHLLQLHAAYSALDSGHDIAARHSAALLHKLPVHRISRVPQFMVPAGSALKSSRTIRRYPTSIDARDVEIICGMRCTTLPRTVLDIIRFGSMEDAVICLDAALRIPSTHDLLGWLDQRLNALKGRYGVRQAKFALAFATDLSESPGESLSRIRMHQLGLPAPELQVPVISPTGYPYRLDFLIRELNIFGEFDGLSKYEPNPVIAREAILKEKKREDWIRAQTNWKCVRWDWSDLRSPQTFARIWKNAGIQLPSTYKPTRYPLLYGNFR